jgi:broad-specificity NMP kinase
MNIAQAKEQIINAMSAYLKKDEFGEYRVPVERQRPVFMIGPPGVGKTAIMEQVAAELGVGLVSYSMTHHTRQSALGLPYITDQDFGGKGYRATEYTMSEIIATIYDLMRRTGHREGILFLDEINCVSETLAPCMLQFLQFKIFGQHRVPPGWIVVTAGNPPEYNKSVRDFDIVTWDRLKRVDVEPDYEVWRAYALLKGVHPSVTSYLAARRKDFYKVESGAAGKRFVTPRGWDDLSEMIRLYEEMNLTVDAKLVGQYLQDERTARDFSIYYDLFRKYRGDYQIDSILAGAPSEAIILRAENAALDERLALLGLMLDAVSMGARQVREREDVLDELMASIKRLNGELNAGIEPAKALEAESLSRRQGLEAGREARSVSPAAARVLRRTIEGLDSLIPATLAAPSFEATKGGWRLFFDGQLESLKGEVAGSLKSLANVFSFCERAFGEGDEILILVAELTVNYHTARLIGRHGCEAYARHASELKFHERQKDLSDRVAKIDWDLWKF